MKFSNRLDHVVRPIAAMSFCFALASCGGAGSTGSVVDSGAPLPQRPNGSPGAQPLLYVPNAQPYPIAIAPGNSVTVLPAMGNGDVSPVQLIKGPHTQLNDPGAATLDSNGTIYVTNTACCAGNPSPESITAFAHNATGDVAPIQAISGSNTQLALPSGIVFDQSNNLYVANTRGGIGRGVGTVLVFSAGAVGNVAPMKTIAGTKTGLSIPEGIAVDAARNIYVTNFYPGACGATGAVTEYAAGASGDVAPIAFIGGPKTRLNFPLGIAFDRSGNMYITNQGGSVTVYAAGSRGNVAPIESFSVFSPAGIAVDATGNIYVSSSDQTIKVYAPGASGNAVPIRTISGPDTGITEPVLMTLH